MAIPVSVIIPTYNRAAFLSAAIDSVLDQRHAPLELIVVDDGSTDDTAGVLARYGEKLVAIRQQNRGPAAARNTGILAARYPLIAFLDSDDFFLPGKVSMQSEEMAKHPGFLISHTEEKWLRRGLHLNQKKRHRKTGGNLFARSLELCVVGMSTVMARRELFDEAGLFDEDLPCCEDYDLWLRAGARFPFLFIDTPLTVKNGGRPDQVSVRYGVGMDRFRIQAIRNSLEAGRFDSAQQRLALQELVRKCRIYGNGCMRHGRNDEGNSFLDLAARYEAELFR